MLKQNLNFMKSLELPKRFKPDQPTTRFDDGLSRWEQLRSDELDSASPPGYEYYATVFNNQISSAWHNNDSAFRAESSQDDDDPEYWTFNKRGDHPARALGATAYLFGWRLVPLARWAGKKLHRPDIPFNVENACRAWCASADTAYRILAKQTLTRSNLASQQATILPLRKEAFEIEMLVISELRGYFRF